MKYTPTIGLEIHAELKTASKMFCDCVNDPEETHANTNVCPICLAHPGTLPVPNKKAVESVIRVGLACGGTIPAHSKFDRKNYFYPDLPKGYQISQFDEPLVLGGELAGVKLTRIHLEEDTGRLVHAKDEKGKDVTLVDYNRAGVPLMELVTEPVIHDAETALRFAKELQRILRYLSASDANMEKGEMRVEANISISGTDVFGTKVEVKNLNSFRAVEGAIAYELKRQEEALGKGEEIKQETRGWDEEKLKTVSQRSKEGSHDYRYFPEPDIPPLDASIFDIEALRASLPELPPAKRVRLVREYGITEAQAEFLSDDNHLSDYFEEAVSEMRADAPEGKPLTVLNYLTSDLWGILKDAGVSLALAKVTPMGLGHLAALIETGKLSSRMAKDILKEMFETGLDPHEIIAEKGIEQVSDEDAIGSIVATVITENPNAVLDFKKGKESSMQFLIGKTMAALKGKGNPAVIAKVLREILTASGE